MHFLEKNMEKVRKHRDCHNREKKKLFVVGTKLSYYKVFHRKFISNRMKNQRHLWVNLPI